MTRHDATSPSSAPPADAAPGFDPHALRVLEARYLRRDEAGRVVETPAEMLWRVAHAVASVEARQGGDADLQARRFYEVLARLEFLPNSPTLMNAGRPKGQLSACFVLPVEDELESIFETVKHAARIHQTGGGTGFSFTRLRPRHARLSSGGEASGPVSFMKVFDAATAAVYQGGVRRGANMGILRVDHPDVLEFVDAKRDLSQLTHFNISVAATDAFMQAVEAGTRYDLLDPRTREPVGSLDARTVWDRVVRSAWATGDPGLVFIDRINALHPTPELGAIESTNPCVTGDTWVFTGAGPAMVSELVGRPIEVVVNGQRFAAPGGFFPSGTKPAFEVATREGHRVRTTEDHKLLTAEGSWVRVGDLRPGDVLALHDHRGLDGWIGSGRSWRELVTAVLGGDPRETTARSRFDDGRRFAERRRSAPRVHDETPEIVLVDLERHLREQDEATIARGVTVASFTTVTEEAGAADHRAFLAGVFETAGWPASDATIHLRGTRAVVAATQRMLLRLGIPSRLDGDGSLLRLEIAPGSAARFEALVGFRDPVRRRGLRAVLETVRPVEAGSEAFTATVAAVEALGDHVVFDVQVPGANRFDANGFVARNCGELPLLPYESCNLGSVDLHKHLREDGKDLDWERLSRTVQVATRFLDDVIDANVYPLEQIERITHTNRKVGLGVMGWADLLIALGVPYDSQRALDLAGEVMAFILREARAASQALARERGAFGAWEGSRPQRAGEAPLRNATVTTIAPTGTIALLAGCSSGIEPLYAVAYVRRALDGQARLEIFHPMLEKLARARGCWSEAVREHVLATGSLARAPGVPDDVKALFRTAHEIAPEWHVRMQAAFQAHCENAVSKTVNAPRTSTPEDVARTYQLAYRLGCKGITIYRDGSREGQVLATRAAAAHAPTPGPEEPGPLPPASCPECAPTEAGDVP